MERTQIPIHRPRARRRARSLVRSARVDPVPVEWDDTLKRHRMLEAA